MDEFYRKAIAAEFERPVNHAIAKMNEEGTNAPFHEALLTKEAVFWGRFERSFSTSFGQRSIEEISRLAALSGGASQAMKQKKTNISIDEAYMNAINGYENPKGRGKVVSWEESLDSVLILEKTGRVKQCVVTSDLWWKKDDVDHYVSIKTVRPNIDQTVKAKTDCLKLSVNNPSCKTYYGLYYNPYGPNKSDYSHAPPMKTFDFHKDPVVLIGKEYWDTLGGNGFYEDLLEIAEEIGCKTRKDIEEMRSHHQTRLC